MDKVITVDPYDPSSYDRAIRAIKRYEIWANKKALELCNKLAGIGANVASIHFAGGFISGNDDVTISVVPLNNGYQIVADGQSVCFLEFGAGVAAGNGYDTDEIVPPVPIYPGSYSQTKGKGIFTEDHPYWFHDGQYYSMVTPRMGMYHAVSEMKRQVAQIAKEVFGS